MTLDNREFRHERLQGPWLYRKLITLGFLGELYKMAYFDPETNLPNKNYWNRYAPKMYDEVVTRHGGELCVAYIDFDWMKVWNDSQGHLKTDQLLADAGKLMVTNVFGFRNGHDLVTKWGGDEFSAAMPYTTIEKASRACQRVLDHLRTLEKEYVMEPTATIGLASSRMGFRNFHDLAKAADDTLIRAKRNPQNKGQVHICDTGI